MSNDYSYQQVFAKQIKALAVKDDLFIGLSTSGNSENIIEAVNFSKKLGLKTLIFTGKDGGKLADKADICMKIPSKRTARIQEGHIFLIHALCEFIDNKFTGYL